MSDTKPTQVGSLAQGTPEEQFCAWLSGYLGAKLGRDELNEFEANDIRNMLNRALAGHLVSPKFVGSLAEGATDRGQFASLRAANEVRQREWDVLGQLTLAYRGNELAGEVGEACNVIKKLERERLGINGSRDTVEHLAEELADVIICTDLIAMQAGIDLEGAVVAKFNASSEKVGLKTRMVRRQSPAASASELPAWEDPRVQTVYNMLCDPALDTPPNPEEHWEGWVSRNIVKALCPSQPVTADEFRKVSLQFGYPTPPLSNAQPESVTPQDILVEIDDGFRSSTPQEDVYGACVTLLSKFNITRKTTEEPRR